MDDRWLVMCLCTIPQKLYLGNAWPEWIVSSVGLDKQDEEKGLHEVIWIEAEADITTTGWGNKFIDVRFCIGYMGRTVVVVQQSEARSRMMLFCVFTAAATWDWSMSMWTSECINRYFDNMAERKLEIAVQLKRLSTIQQVWVWACRIIRVLLQPLYRKTVSKTASSINRNQPGSLFSEATEQRWLSSLV